MRKKKDGSEMSETEQAAAPQERVTPLDIQEKVFRSQPGLRGYNEREVDEFLDRVTEELARVHAENQRLREQLSAAVAGGPARATAQQPAAHAPATTEIGAEYIARERDFLKNLAALIQGHAESVRQDVRRAMEARSAPAPDVAAAAVAETPMVLPETAPPGGDPARRLDPVLAGEQGSPPADDQTIRELFWGED